jgi:hypothetical protein
VPESWSVFGERVRRRRPRRRGARAAVLVLTSGGVRLRAWRRPRCRRPTRRAIDLNLSCATAALCEFTGPDGGLALGSWNALPHLHDARELWTYY